MKRWLATQEIIHGDKTTAEELNGKPSYLKNRSSISLAARLSTDYKLLHLIRFEDKSRISPGSMVISATRYHIARYPRTVQQSDRPVATLTPAEQCVATQTFDFRGKPTVRIA